MGNACAGSAGVEERRPSKAQRGIELKETASSASLGPPTEVRDVSDEAVLKELEKRGIVNPRVREALLVAFDHNDDGKFSADELSRLFTHVDRITRKEVKAGDPPEIKAFLNLGSTGKGAFTKPGNPKLKMFLTSAGLMPGSTPHLKERFATLKAKTEGKGVLYLVDARMPTLQFHLLNATPSKHNQHKYVAYKRTPEAPGGTPEMNEAGELVMKSMSELADMGPEGYAQVPWNLHHRGFYGNCHVGELAGFEEGTPVYVAYLWYNGKLVNGHPDYHIMVGKGAWKDGKYVAYRAADGGEFTEDDYNEFSSYSTEADHFFSTVTGAEFEELVSSVQVAYGCGGVPYLPISHFQPHFVDDGKKTNVVNPYGKTILDNVKAGKIVYVGMSAGAMAFGWTLGPLTTDPDQLMLVDERDDGVKDVDLGARDAELGSFWLFPGLGEYVGMPHDISYKVHLAFEPNKMAYDSTAQKAAAVTKVVSGIIPKDKYVALLVDYDWYKGQGDALEVSDGGLKYHVGYSSDEDQVPEAFKQKLAELKFSGITLPRQPPGNPASGWSFDWKPTDGEVYAAGPKAKKPFHLYASSTGLMADGNPAYPTVVTAGPGQ